MFVKKLTPLIKSDSDLHSCDSVILNDPGVDVLDVGLDDVVIHVVDGTDDALTKSVLLLHSRIVIESKKVSIFIFQKFILKGKTITTTEYILFC